ncbi:MAG: helix-turn-helix domain-containing protein [Xanthomonadaceae bacterium]|nr:helix-turn-helix domain-containing protein [Xanthomonadaceae bacterium]
MRAPHDAGNAAAPRTDTHSLERAIGLLRELATRKRTGWPLGEMAMRCQLEKGATRRLLAGLEREQQCQQRLDILKPTELRGPMEQLARAADVRLPVVLRHPVTARRTLYADPITQVFVERLSDHDEARMCCSQQAAIRPMCTATGSNQAT